MAHVQVFLRELFLQSVASFGFASASNNHFIPEALFLSHETIASLATVPNSHPNPNAVEIEKTRHSCLWPAVLLASCGLPRSQSPLCLRVHARLDLNFGRARREGLTNLVSGVSFLTFSLAMQVSPRKKTVALHDQCSVVDGLSCQRAIRRLKCNFGAA